jgi:excisionase family DNA binding protein
MEGSVSLREAAAQVGVSVRTMRRYVRNGQVDATQVVGPHGPEWRISPETLASLIEKRGQAVKGSRGQVDVAVTDTVAMTLATRIDADSEALERAWQKVADLEAENATLRTRLEMLPATVTKPQEASTIGRALRSRLRAYLGV